MYIIYELKSERLKDLSAIAGISNTTSAVAVTVAAAAVVVIIIGVLHILSRTQLEKNVNEGTRRLITELKSRRINEFQKVYSEREEESIFMGP